MSGVNKVIILGNLGRDPETRYMPSGDAVTTFSVATSESWKDKNTGEKRESTEWHNCVAFRRLGEIAGTYLKKGSKIYLEGKLKTETYEKDGAKRYSTKIIVDQLQMLGSRDGSADSSASDDGAVAHYDERAARTPAPSRDQTSEPPMMDDEIPF
jgi:single-strand DNA-binding protein